MVSPRHGARVKVKLYSAIYGGYDTVKAVPEHVDVPCIMFTDDLDTAADAESKGWQPIIVQLPHIPTPMLRHKWWKVNPVAAVPDADITLWVDASMDIIVDRYVERCVDALGDDDFVTVTHPARTCIYDEAWFSAALPRYDAPSLHEQIAYYRSIGHPDRWGLFATGANVRRKSDAIAELGRHWWWENLHRTHQDQVSLPVLMRIMGDRLKWNTNMPWGEWWGIWPHLK